MSVWTSGNAAARLKRQQQLEKQRLEMQQQSCMVEVKAIVKSAAVEADSHDSLLSSDVVTVLASDLTTPAMTTPAATSTIDAPQKKMTGSLNAAAPSDVCCTADDDDANAAAAASAIELTKSQAHTTYKDACVPTQSCGAMRNKVQLPSHLTALLAPGRFVFTRCSPSASATSVGAVAEQAMHEHSPSSLDNNPTIPADPCDGELQDRTEVCVAARQPNAMSCSDVESCLVNQTTTSNPRSAACAEAECHEQITRQDDNNNSNAICNNYNNSSNKGPHISKTYYANNRNQSSQPSYRGRYGSRVSAAPTMSNMTPYAQWAAPYIHNSFGAIPRDYEMRKQLEVQHAQNVGNAAHPHLYSSSVPSYSPAGFAVGLSVDAVPYTMHAGPVHSSFSPMMMMSNGSCLTDMPGNFYGRLQPRPPYVPPPL